MRESGGRTRRHFGRRHLLTGALAAVISIASLGAVAMASDGPTAGEGALGGGVPGIAVTGIGEANAPAESAVLQLIVRFSGDHGAHGKQGTPDAGVPSIAEGDVAPLIAALTGAGVPADALSIDISPIGFFGGPFGPGTAVIVAQLDQELLPRIDDIVTAAVDAATEQGLLFDQVGVGYHVSDCGSVEREALADAVANGEQQATELADVLGVTLGDLMLATRLPVYAGYGGPVSTFCEAMPTVETAAATYLPPYNPTLGPEVEIYLQVNLTYAIA